ncbi:MAG: transcription-repair coupling factor, partial [Arcobacteraceae bacterium]|nr:transcription-repair coupling factor [Arcobacteraceae bacterium]
MNNIFNYLKNNKPDILIVADEKEAEIASSCVSYLGNTPFVLSDFRANAGDDLNSFSEELKIITKILEQYYRYKKQNKVLIAPIRTISYPLPKENCFKQFKIEFGDTVNLREFKDKLYNWGYVFVDIVTAEGEVSVRGDIIDIAFLDEEFGYRISLFDDEVES